MALTDFFQTFRLIRRTELPDGYGGTEITHEVLTTFNAGISANRSNEAVIAGRVGKKTIYTVTTLMQDELEQNDIIQRVSDGLVLRVTSDASEMTTPAVATIQYRDVTAEVIE